MGGSRAAPERGGEVAQCPNGSAYGRHLSSISLRPSSSPTICDRSSGAQRRACPPQRGRPATLSQADTAGTVKTTARSRRIRWPAATGRPSSAAGAAASVRASCARLPHGVSCPESSWAVWPSGLRRVGGYGRGGGPSSIITEREASGPGGGAGAPRGRQRRAWRRLPAGPSGGLFRLLPGVAREALELLAQALLFGTVLPRVFVGEVWVAVGGVQRVQLVDVAVGPVEKVDRLALQVGGGRL